MIRSSVLKVLDRHHIFYIFIIYLYYIQVYYFMIHIYIYSHCKFNNKYLKDYFYYS